MATAAIGAGASLLGGYFQNKAASKATKAQTQSNQQAIDFAKYQFDQMQHNQQPYMQYGADQLGALGKLASGDYSGFQNSPDYLYARDEMLGGLDASHAARGSLYSGGADIDRMRHLNGLASQNLNNYRGFEQWGANLGQNSAAGVGQSGMGLAGQVGSYLQNQGNARADGAIAQGNNWANTFGNLGTGLSGLLGQSSYAQPSLKNIGTK